MSKELLRLNELTDEGLAAALRECKAKELAIFKAKRDELFPIEQESRRIISLLVGRGYRVNAVNENIHGEYQRYDIIKTMTKEL